MKANSSRGPRFGLNPKATPRSWKAERVAWKQIIGPNDGLLPPRPELTEPGGSAFMKLAKTSP